MQKKINYIKFVLFMFLVGIMKLNVLYSQNFNPHEFTTNGYARAGIGVSDGGQMVNFVTPDNVHKYRLGNEANHYAELQLNYRYKDTDSTKKYELTYMMAKYIPYGSDAYKQFPLTTQLYGKINRVIHNADIWVGKRYYSRRNVDFLDYFWMNPAQGSQIGLGIENYKVKNSGNLNLAFMRFKYPDPNSNNSHSYTTDLRYLDVPLSESNKINFIGQFNYTTENKILQTSKHLGYAIGTWWTYSKKNITHTSTVIYRKGSSIVETSGPPIQEFVNGVRVYDLNKASSLDVINNFLYDDKTTHAFNAAVTYQRRDFGMGNTDQNGNVLDHRAVKNWFSVGFRYVHYINKHFNLAVEAGNDYMKSDGLGLEGSLQKISFSPQLTWDYGYYTRPVFRPFVTYAHWSDSFRGITGQSDFNTRLINKNQGISFGLQMEMWW